MLRFLVVLNQDVSIDVDEYRRVFAGTHLIVTRETSSTINLLCQQNPDVIISLGHIPSESFLWTLPLWRRLRWLNLPDGRHSAIDVRQSALSLLAGTCDRKLIADEEIIGVVCMSQNPVDVAEAYQGIYDARLYDNFAFLVQQDDFDEVVNLLSIDPVLGAVVKIPKAIGSSPLSQLQNAAFHSMGAYLWPISRGSLSLTIESFNQMISAGTKAGVDGVIAGNEVGGDVVVKEISRQRVSSISQLLLKTDYILRSRLFGSEFPVESLSGFVLSLATSPNVEFISSNIFSYPTPEDWWVEGDEHRKSLLSANVRYVQHKYKIYN